MYMYVNKRVELAQRGIALYKIFFIIIVLFERCTRHSLVDIVVVITQRRFSQDQASLEPETYRWKADTSLVPVTVHFALTVQINGTSYICVYLYVRYRAQEFYGSRFQGLFSFGPWGLESEVTVSHDIPYEQVHEIHESGGGRPEFPVSNNLSVSVDVKQHCTGNGWKWRWPSWAPRPT